MSTSGVTDYEVSKRGRIKTYPGFQTTDQTKMRKTRWMKEGCTGVQANGKRSTLQRPYIRARGWRLHHRLYAPYLHVGLRGDKTPGSSIQLIAWPNSRPAKIIHQRSNFHNQPHTQPRVRSKRKLTRTRRRAPMGVE